MGENPLTILGWGQGEVAPFPFKPVPLATLWVSILGLGGRYCFGNWEKLCEVCLSQMLFFTRTRCFSKRKTLKAFWEALVQHPHLLLLAQWVWAHMVPWGSMEIHTVETSLPPCCPALGHNTATSCPSSHQSHSRLWSLYGCSAFTVSMRAIREGNWKRPTVVLRPRSAVIPRLPLNPKEHRCWVHAAQGLPPSLYEGKGPWKWKWCPKFCTHHFESWLTGNCMILLFLRWETAYEVLFFKMLLEIEFFRFI